MAVREIRTAHKDKKTLHFGKKNNKFFWSVGAEHQCFFNIGCSTWTCNGRNNRRKMIAVLLLHSNKCLIKITNEL